MKNVALLALNTFLLINLLLPAACVNPPDYPDEPVITYLGLSKNTMRQSFLGADSISVRLSFTDGDGDLGVTDNTVDVFFVDTRDTTMDVLRLPYIEQQGAGNGISGEMYIQVPTTCCIYRDPQGFNLSCGEVINYIQRDTLTYRLWIKDRAGHVSNEVETEPIILICKE